MSIDIPQLLNRFVSIIKIEKKKLVNQIKDFSKDASKHIKWDNKTLNIYPEKRHKIEYIHSTCICVCVCVWMSVCVA